MNTAPARVRGRLITQSTSGVPGSSEAGDHFGWSLAVDDLTNDGRADILVGSPGENVGSRADAGAVPVVSFAAGAPIRACLLNNCPPRPRGFKGVVPLGGTSAATAVSLTQNDLRGVAETGGRLGYTVAAADFQGDEFGSLRPGTVSGPRC